MATNIIKGDPLYQSLYNIWSAEIDKASGQGPAQVISGENTYTVTRINDTDVIFTKEIDTVFVTTKINKGDPLYDTLLAIWQSEYGKAAPGQGPMQVIYASTTYEVLRIDDATLMFVTDNQNTMKSDISLSWSRR